MIHLLLASLVLSSIGIVLLIWVGSSKLIIPHRRALEIRHREMLAHPADHGLDLERIDVITHDGLTLSAILATRAKKPGLAEKTRRMAARLGLSMETTDSRTLGTVILLHGRGGIKEDMLVIAQRFVAGGYRCLVYDARGHGTSGGTVCTFGHHETQDLSSVLDQVTTRLSERGESPGQICAMGISLGASVLLQALPHEPRIDAAIAVAPFAELSEVVTLSAKHTLHSCVPDWLVFSTMQAGGLRAGFDPLHISPLREMCVATTPVFFAHGARDAVIPLSHSERLHKVAPAPKILRCVLTGNHHNILAEGGDDLYQEMIEFCLRLES